MGALHEGHLALIRRARQLAGPKGSVAVSIFVNPTQFGPGEDFSRYPRPLARDRELCRAAGVDLLFVPPVEAIYAPDSSIRVLENQVSLPLCGASRPGHFDGVCTVVAKLFLILQPDVAVFGRKDWQQLAVIRRLVRDLHFPVRVVGVPTVREADGLALSSRNRYLTPKERASAAGIYAALRRARERILAGERSVARAKSGLHKDLSRLNGATVDYAEAVEADSLRVPPRLLGNITLAVAVKFGSARLIDNIQVKVPT